ncbi:MAG: metal-dependent hydrolase [Litoricolaceae bacterium]|nr:metal-dependent hydrolase [Litorivicinaceae bacterium]
MDSLTQAALGGVVTYAVLGPTLGKRAAIYGMALGTLPDLDILIDFGGPIENMTHHRGFSHSFLVQTAVSPILGWLFSQKRGKREASLRQWSVAIFLCFITHSLADFFTVYGTQLLWPLTDHPFAHAILFIIDPAYTVPLIIALIGILVMRDRGASQKLNLSMLTLSTMYLIWSVGAKSMIDQQVQFALTARGIQPDIYESAPAPLNTLLWRAVAVEEDTYYEIWVSVFDAVDDIQVRQFDRSLTLLQPIENHPSVRRLQWFTKGQYKAWHEGDVIYLSDLRMGIEGAYVFNFEVGRRSGETFTLGNFTQLSERPNLQRLPMIWERIFDPSVSIGP